MLKIAICDDELTITTEIENRLKSICSLKHILLDIDIYYDGETLSAAMCNNKHYDLIYMDIEMKHTDGIETAHIIRALGSATLLIYISAHDTYFRQLVDVEPFRFLSKPIDTGLFNKYFDEAYKRLCSKTQFFSFTFKQVHYKLPLSDIIYFESEKRYIIIHTTSKDYRFLEKLNTLEKVLQKKQYEFIRIHQSFIINPFHIRTISLADVILSNGCQLSISPKYRDMVRTYYLEHAEEL